MRFSDRTEAGRQLAALLEPRFRDTDVVVLGLPRGGVPVASEVARALGAPLDVIVVRKLGVPFQPELAMGAIGEDGVRVINDDVVRAAKVSHAEIAAIEAAERAEIERRAERFRTGRPRIPIAGKTVIIVDDGIATGSTAKAACQVARAHGAARVVVAAPVAPRDCQARFAGDADEVICLHQPRDFWAVGQFYVDFSQTTDEEVAHLLATAAARTSPLGVTATGNATDDPSGLDEEVTIPAGPVQLRGHLCIPTGAAGLVVFVHGSGSSRHSPRNRYVAQLLNAGGLGTLLFDLLTPGEEADRANVFDIDLLAERLGHATAWLREQPAAQGLPVGCFGASTGAAAALWAAAEPDSQVAAIVSRGGRPDLAIPRLEAVRAPTLLIVGSRDEVVLELNRRAQAHLRCENRLEVVPGATHLFEEPGALDRVASLARDWLTSHLMTIPGASE